MIIKVRFTGHKKGAFPLKKKKMLFCIITALILTVMCISLLFYCGVLHFNNIDREKYPIIGVDVSSYQGEIDWNRLSENDIQFAFIKATEGSSFVDPFFEKNWNETQNTDLRIGAYHFFSFESPGINQAKSFCETVPKVKNMLPPVIDVEYYNSFKSSDDIDVTKIKKELRDCIDIIEGEYSVKPIIYMTNKSFEEIIQDDFADCCFWYRSVYSKAPDNISWTFWQYSNRHILEGYTGKERYIDMNVFYGTNEEFSAFPAE